MLLSLIGWIITGTVRDSASPLPFITEIWISDLRSLSISLVLFFNDFLEGNWQATSSLSFSLRKSLFSLAQEDGFVSYTVLGWQDFPFHAWVLSSTLLLLSWLPLRPSVTVILYLHCLVFWAKIWCCPLWYSRIFWELYFGFYHEFWNFLGHCHFKNFSAYFLSTFWMLYNYFRN